VSLRRTLTCDTWKAVISAVATFLGLDCFLWFPFRHFSTEAFEIIQDEIKVEEMYPYVSAPHYEGILRELR
jgi:hypothetical protein